jgi:hypothetical protein
MNQTLHIFKKDVRRLWWAISIALVLVAALGHIDRWRADWLVGSAEGLLNLLLPLAWACLIAMAVHGEPLAGDRHFWLTRPYRWPALLASKMLFVLVFVHLPYFLENASVLASRGFSPWAYVPQLLWKQLVLAVVLTVPAIGLAALFENITHFLLAAIAIAGAAVYVVGSSQPVRLPWLAAFPFRASVSLVALACGAVVVIAVQYARRRTRLSRIIGLATAVFAGLLFSYLQPALTAHASAALHPAHATISLHLAPATAELPPGLRFSLSQSSPVQVAIPIAVSGIPDGVEVRPTQLTLEVAVPGGRRYRTSSPYRSDERVDMDASLYASGNNTDAPKWLVLRFRNPVYEGIKNQKIDVRGTYGVDIYHPGEPVMMALAGERWVPGVGRCSSFIDESPNAYQGGLIKVLCESPLEVSPMTRVRFWQLANGRERDQRLGDSAPMTAGLRGDWLSPVHRLQTFFQLISGAHDDSLGSRWMVSCDTSASCRIAITPSYNAGQAATDFELRGIVLSDYRMSPKR